MLHVVWIKCIACVLVRVAGGLDEALNNIIVIAQEQTVPVVFALGRRALGRACAKLVPVSVVGIFNYEGCEVMASRRNKTRHNVSFLYVRLI